MRHGLNPALKERMSLFHLISTSKSCSLAGESITCYSIETYIVAGEFITIIFQ